MENQNEKVIITNYKGFVDLLKEIGLLGENESYTLLPTGHIPIDAIKNKEIIGGSNLPMFVKCFAASQTIVNLQITDEWKRKELNVEQYLKCLRTVEVFITVRLNRKRLIDGKLVDVIVKGD